MEEMNNNNETNESINFENRIDLSQLKLAVSQIKAELSKIIIGQEEFMNLLLVALLSDGACFNRRSSWSSKNHYRKIVSKNNCNKI